MNNNVRLKDESWEAFKDRRRAMNKALKNYLKGKIVHRRGGIT